MTVLIVMYIVIVVAILAGTGYVLSLVAKLLHKVLDESPLSKEETRTIIACEREQRERADRAEKALRVADEGLRDARDGLDLGLGCARQLENDSSPVPTEPRSVRQDNYLNRARAAHAQVRSALEEAA